MFFGLLISSFTLLVVYSSIYSTLLNPFVSLSLISDIIFISSLIHLFLVFHIVNVLFFVLLLLLLKLCPEICCSTYWRRPTRNSLLNSLNVVHFLWLTPSFLSMGSMSNNGLPLFVLSCPFLWLLLPVIFVLMTDLIMFLLMLIPLHEKFLFCKI